MLDACSLMNKIDELITVVQTYKPHIVAITETWLHEQINDTEIIINDYHIFLKDREGRGGGALLFIKSSLRPKQQIQLKHDGTTLTDLVSSTLAISNTTLNVLCVYQSASPLRVQDTKLLDTQEEFLSKKRETRMLRHFNARGVSHHRIVFTQCILLPQPLHYTD